MAQGEGEQAERGEHSGGSGERGVEEFAIHQGAAKAWVMDWTLWRNMASKPASWPLPLPSAMSGAARVVAEAAAMDSRTLALALYSGKIALTLERFTASMVWASCCGVLFCSSFKPATAMTSKSNSRAK